MLWQNVKLVSAICEKNPFLKFFAFIRLWKIFVISQISKSLEMQFKSENSTILKCWISSNWIGEISVAYFIGVSFFTCSPTLFHSSYLLHPIASFPVGCFWYVIYGLSSFPFSNCLLLLALLDKFNFEPVLFCIPGNSNLFSPPVGLLALILISDSEWFLLNKDGPRKLFIWFIFSALLKMWC